MGSGQFEKLKDTKEDCFGEQVEEVGQDQVTESFTDLCKCIPYLKLWEAIPGII